MHLTKDNCQVAYFYTLPEESGEEVISIAVKLKDIGRVVSMRYLRSTTEDNRKWNQWLRVKMSQILELFMSQPKPILLVVNSPSSPFLPVQRLIQESEMVHSFYGVIAAFANADPTLMNNIQSQMKALSELPNSVKKILEQKYTKRWHDMEWSVNALEKILTDWTNIAELIAISDSYAEVILSELNAQQLEAFKIEFKYSVADELISILENIERPGLPYQKLADAFDQHGYRGIEFLLSERQSNGELRIKDQDQEMVNKLRWILYRTEHYHKEISFANRQSQNNLAIDEFPVNHIPVGQVPVNPAPANGIPVNKSPINGHPSGANPNYRGFVDRR